MRPQGLTLPLQPFLGSRIFGPFAESDRRKGGKGADDRNLAGQIEGGDTERDGQSYATMRFIDHEAEAAVVVFLQAETERGMIADLYGWAQSRGMTSRSN
jgi:hypothetical protein